MDFLKLIALLLAALSLPGCSEDFTPDIDTTPVLCINSLITAGEPIEVKVSHTRLYTDDSYSDCSVPDAIVTIHANGELKGPDYLPEEGDVITVRAKSAIYGSAEAKVTVPYAVPVESIEWTQELVDLWYVEHPEASIFSMAGDLRFNLSVAMKIVDPAITENYYRLSIIGFNFAGDEEYGDDVTFSFGTLQYESEPIFSEHIGVFESVMGNDAGMGFTFFTDRQFSGKDYTLHLIFNNASYSVKMYGEWNPELFDCGLTLTLHTISQSYYNWVNYLWQRDEGSLNELGEIGLGDPMWGYSNVSTGAGVVAAQSFRTTDINLKDFIEETILSLKWSN